MQTVKDRKEKGIRTVMYSVERIEKRVNGKGTGEYEDVVVEHRLPWTDEDKWGMQKLASMEKRGYTYERPGLAVEEEVSEVVEVSVSEEVAPLYVSDKPAKPKAKRKVKK